MQMQFSSRWKRMRFFRQSVTLLLTLVFITGCQSSCQPYSAPTANPTTQPAITWDVPLFVFDRSAVRTFEIAMHDPAKNEPWSARFEKKDRWTVAFYSGGELRDTLADGGFIEHLLSTLTTVSAVAEAPPGTRAAYGLAPPVFAMKWADSELHVGLTFTSANDSGKIAEVPGRTAQPVVVKGAAIEMLSHIQNFNFLRLKTVLPFQLDDVQGINLQGAQPPIRHVDREGIRWVAARSSKNLSEDFVSALERLSHLRVLRFVDEPEFNLGQPPIYRLQFQGLPVGSVSTPRDLGTLEIYRQKNQLFARMNARGTGWLELYPESLPLFTQLLKLSTN